MFFHLSLRGAQRRGNPDSRPHVEMGTLSDYFSSNRGVAVVYLIILRYFSGAMLTGCESFFMLNRIRAEPCINVGVADMVLK